MSRKRFLVPKETVRIDRPSIVRAAFTVLGQKGLDGLSLRVLAAELGVQAPALYWHVHNKAELLGMMAATFGDAAANAKPKDPSWSALLIAYGHALRQAMLLHRDAARLCAIAPPIEDPAATARHVAAPLVAAGLDMHRALSCQASVIAFTLGWVVYEQSQPMHEHLAQMLDLAESFDFGLRSMVKGFSVAIEGTGAVKPNTRPRRARTRDRLRHA